jgi:hypothetical protein
MAQRIVHSEGEWDSAVRARHRPQPREWQRFVAQHAPLVTAAGLPPRATASREDWDDLLMHGFLAHDPGDFTLDALSPAAHAALCALATQYFAVYFPGGDGAYTPIGLQRGRASSEHGERTT